MYKDAISLFADLSDLPVYHLNKDHKTVSETVNKYQRQKRTIYNRLRRILFGNNIVMKEYQPYKVDYIENKLKHIKDKKIIDFLWYADNSEQGFILLENGYLITETNVAPHGTGLAGLNFYENINDLTNAKGNEYFKLTEKKSIR